MPPSFPVRQEGSNARLKKKFGGGVQDSMLVLHHREKSSSKQQVRPQTGQRSQARNRIGRHEIALNEINGLCKRLTSVERVGRTAEHKTN